MSVDPTLINVAHQWPNILSLFFSFYIFGEEAPTINNASDFVGKEHKEHSPSSVTEHISLEVFSRRYLLVTIYFKKF